MPRFNRWWQLILVSLVMLGGVFSPGVVQANMGAPTTGGQLAVEPTGLEKVEITHETLNIDLRPLRHAQPVFVEAIYQVNNLGPQQKLDLVFVTGAPTVDNFQVWLNEQAIASQLVSTQTLPVNWQPPKQTPSLDNTLVARPTPPPGQITPPNQPSSFVNGQGLDYYPEYTSYPRQDNQLELPALAFTLVLPSGPQTIKVRYTAEAMWRHSDEPTDYWQFAYILAPARTWARFGGLDATITLPAGWRAAVTPAFLRHADVLQASFADLPADAIALTVQAPASWLYFLLVYLSRTLFILVGLSGIVLCWQAGRAIGRRQATSWFSAGLLPVLWGVGLCIFGLLAIFAPDWVLPALQKRAYGYGKPLGLIGLIALSLLSMPIGWVMIWGVAWFSRVRSRRARSS